MDEKQLQPIRELADNIYLPDITKAGTPAWIREMTLTAISIDEYILAHYPFGDDIGIRDRERATSIFLAVVTPYLAPNK